MQGIPAFPDFENPPVIEVVLGVQFVPIMEIGTPQVGLIWERFRPRFPKTQDQAPLPPVFEVFDVRPRPSRPFRIDLTDKLPVPRCWFLNEAGSELVQVQRDRLIHNWRRVNQAGEYPRYHRIKQTFEEDIRTVVSFLEENRIGSIEPNQWEVTYVNHVPVGELLDDLGSLEQVVTVWQSNYSGSFLPRPENVEFTARYIIRDEAGKPIGRLHVIAQPIYRITDDKLIVVLTLTGRGTPKEPTVESVLQALDIGHEWVVRGFANITTTNAHGAWRRKDGK